MIANIILNGEASDKLTDLVHVYDTNRKKDVDNPMNEQWFQIINKFKQIHDKLQATQAHENINQETDDLLASFDNDEIDQMRQTLDAQPVQKLKAEHDKFQNLIRTKDDIINNANEEIKRLKA